MLFFSDGISNGLFFSRRLGFLWGARTVEQRESAVPEEIRMTCQQFVNYHRDVCVRSIVQDRR